MCRINWLVIYVLSFLFSIIILGYLLNMRNICRFPNEFGSIRPKLLFFIRYWHWGHWYYVLIDFCLLCYEGYFHGGMGNDVGFVLKFWFFYASMISYFRCSIQVFSKVVLFSCWRMKSNNEVTSWYTSYFNVLNRCSKSCWCSKSLISPSGRLGRLTFLFGNSRV